MSRPVLVALSALLIAPVGCKNDLDRVAAVEVRESGPDRTTANAEYFFSDSGHVRNRLRAGLIEEYLDEKRRQTDLSEGVELVFYDSLGQPGSTLMARRGRIWPKLQRMEVNEQVVFTNVRGERLETERLIWSQDSDRVYTDRPVKVVRARDILYGQGLDAREDFSSYTIRRITGTLFVEQSSVDSASGAQR